MKNQFMHKPSQDGTNDPAGNATGQLYNEQNSMSGIGEERSVPPSPAKSGLLPKRKTGLLQSPETVHKNVEQTSNLLEEADIDPLIHRQLPRLASTQPPIPHVPAANPFSIPADEAPTMHQPATSDRPSYQPSPQNRGGAYPSGMYNNPNGAPPPTSNYGFQGPNPASNHTGQIGNPNPMSNAGFNNVPPGFAPPPSMLQGAGGSKKKKRIPIWARIVIAAMTFLVITGGGAFAYYEFTIGRTVNDIVGASATHRINGQNQTIQESNTDPLTTRTNIMLLGSDTDGKGNDPTTGQPLAQTVIIVTIDPKTNYVGMLSIPRDMQVTDGNYIDEKLDQAFENAWVGNTNKDRAAAAAGHMEDVIQQNYGIHIDHYVWVGLQGFTRVIDDIGGVDIDVTHPMFDDDYPSDSGSGSIYGYMRVNIAPGPQHLTGPEALTYVRTRHADLGGDFGRTDRQQQVLSQIKVKLTQNDTITKATLILNDLDGYLFTDLSLSQLATFAEVAKSVDINKLDHVSFTNNYSTPAPNNTNVLPVCATINAEIQKMFGTPGTCQTQYSSISPPAGTSIASTQPSTTATTTETASVSNQTSANMKIASVSQSTTGSTSTFNNLMNLMLLTVSGSFNAMQ